MKCGPGLLAKDGTQCVSDCIYTDDAGRKYDFTALKRYVHSEHKLCLCLNSSYIIDKFIGICS